MKLEDIKNMSDEEFIELVKKGIKEKNVIHFSPKQMKRLKVLEYVTTCSLACAYTFGILSGTLVLVVPSENYKSVLRTAYFVMLPIVGGISLLIKYHIDKNQEKEDAANFIKKETELKNNILNLKKSIEKLSDEEFNLLIKAINLINENKFDNELIKKSDVLVIANKLIELNGASILKDFETSQNPNNVSCKYNDDGIDLGYSKRKGN